MLTLYLDLDFSTQLRDQWMEDIEAGKMVGVLFCDQSAAFDLCDHKILVYKLRLMEMKQCAVNWIISYLEQRRQSCYVDGELSSPLPLPNFGVPQGSVGILYKS